MLKKIINYKTKYKTYYKEERYNVYNHLLQIVVEDDSNIKFYESCYNGKLDNFENIREKVRKNGFINKKIYDEIIKNGFMFACGGGQLEIVEKLGAEYGNFNFAYDIIMKGIILTCLASHYNVFEKLVTLINITNDDIHHIFSYAYQGGDFKIIEKLLSFTNIKFPLYICPMTIDISVVKFLIIKKTYIEFDYYTCYDKLYHKYRKGTLENTFKKFIKNILRIQDFKKIFNKMLLI